MRMNNNDEPILRASPSDNVFYAANLTKREYFAGIALLGLLACSDPEAEFNPQKFCKTSIRFADELLKQLES